MPSASSTATRHVPQFRTVGTSALRHFSTSALRALRHFGTPAPGTSVMSLPTLFSPTFANRPNAVALEWACQEYSFADLDRRADARWRASSSARGLRRGDRLAIYLPNRVEYIDLFLACTRLGVIVVPINILYRDREMRHILDDATPKAVVVGRCFGVGTRRACRRGASTPSRTRPPRAPPRPSIASLEAATPAALIYTSGTTGPAKGAVITHGNLCANARMLVDAWRFTAGDRLLLALPAFPRARPRQRRPLLAAVRLPHAAARTLRVRLGRRDAARLSPYGLLRRADDVRAAAGGGASLRRARSAAPSGCACRARRRCRRRSFRTSRRASVSASSSATA